MGEADLDLFPVEACAYDQAASASCGSRSSSWGAASGRVVPCAAFVVAAGLASAVGASSAAFASAVVGYSAPSAGLEETYRYLQSSALAVESLLAGVAAVHASAAGSAFGSEDAAVGSGVAVVVDSGGVAVAAARSIYPAGSDPRP